MLNNQLLTSLIAKAKTFKEHSFKYLNEDILVEAIHLDTPDILLVQKAQTDDGPTEFLWATNHWQSLANGLINHHHILLKFIPENWVDELLKQGFLVYGVLRDYWLSPLEAEQNLEKKLEFATKKDAKVISELTKSNRYVSREFLGETPAFIGEWLKKDESGINAFGCKYPAIILNKDERQIVGVIFVGIYGYESTKGPVLWIRELAVSPPFHGQGRGKKLMKDALHYGVLHGAKRSFLCADDLNKVAIGLYESLGYVANSEECQIDLLKS